MSTPEHRAMQRYIRESPEVRLWAINLVRTCRRPPAVTDYELPDGSTCRVVRRGRDASLIERWVGDLCVWGQAFGRREDHEGQVADVVNEMRADPTAFERWRFTDQQHRETGE